ncbi:hypothetical protein ACH5RR_000204 [Cinchona calisaya]|uniref:Replication factor A C-terminal domain-containing protein n=1 Tax=Cinchona calisaya TaxID=153742 RepID=A0ABD3B0N2_9GENT
MRNSKELRDIVDQETYKKYNPQLSYQPQQNYKLVSNLMVTQTFACVKVYFSFQHIFQKCWYMACKNCNRSTSAIYKFAFTCNSCKQKHPPEPRCRFDVHDQNGRITASIFGDLAEKLLTFTALEAMEHYNQVKITKIEGDDQKQRYTINHYFQENEESSSLGLPNKESPQVLTLSSQAELIQLNSLETQNPVSESRLSLVDKFKQSKQMEEANFPEIENPVSKARLSLADKFEQSKQMEEANSSAATMSPLKKSKVN